MKTVKLIIGTIAGLYALAALIVFTLNLYTGRLHFNSSDAFSIAAAQIACFFIPLTIAILCFSKNGFRPEVKEVSSNFNCSDFYMLFTYSWSIGIIIFISDKQEDIWLV